MEKSEKPQWDTHFNQHVTYVEKLRETLGYYWAVPVFVWPPGMEDSGIPAVFYLVKPYRRLWIIVTFVDLIHGNKVLNGIAGYRRHRIYISINDAIHRSFHGIFFQLMMPSIGISQTKYKQKKVKNVRSYGALYFHGKPFLIWLPSIGISMDFLSQREAIISKWNDTWYTP